ncbi:phosphotransferase [Geothrix oryzae]|uniref:Phosphotransferase n=1 Tax=Geothrix oryzae TaxID=2927975 RepID=A0ABM8DUG1_9BACT|nr:phosphotransferase [Geothrix oryzae]BDU70747.1 phosphotransferase [Geothrix oryzae]
MDARLDRALARWSLSDARPLAGDVGARQYFRAAHPQLGTALVVLHPLDAPGKSDDSYFEFRALQAYLDPVLRVPTIVACDDEDRCLLVEDLGDDTLESRLVAHPEEEQHWARQAGWLLATLAGPLTLGAPPHAFFMGRVFDQAKFQFEWDYCRQNFFQDFLQKDPPRWLERMMDEAHASLETRAHFFAHRDFHVRNLMVHGDRLVVIDFQDARRGAATYDLASILYDGYWDWSREAGRLLVGPLQNELGWNHEALLEELNLSALQRNLKALGTFGHQLVHRRKAHFAPAVPRTLRHLRSHFQRMNHQDGVLACEHMLRLAEERLLKG